MECEISEELAEVVLRSCATHVSSFAAELKGADEHSQRELPFTYAASFRPRPYLLRHPFQFFVFEQAIGELRLLCMSFRKPALQEPSFVQK